MQELLVILVARFILADNIAGPFHLPLSALAHQEYLELQVILQQLQVQEGAKDAWRYQWGQHIHLLEAVPFCYLNYY